MSALGPALVTAAIVLVGNLIMVAFISGKHSQRISSVEKDVDQLGSVDKEQWAELNNHGERITWLEAKSNGKLPH